MQHTSDAEGKVEYLLVESDRRRETTTTTAVLEDIWLVSDWNMYHTLSSE